MNMGYLSRPSIKILFKGIFMQKYCVVLLMASLPLFAMDNMQINQIKVPGSYFLDTINHNQTETGPCSLSEDFPDINQETRARLDAILQRYTRSHASSKEFSESEPYEKRMLLNEAVCYTIQACYWATHGCSDKNVNVNDLQNNLKFLLDTFKVDLSQGYATTTYTQAITNPLQVLVKLDLLPVFHFLKALRPDTFKNKYLIQQMLSYKSIGSTIKEELEHILVGLQ